VFRIGFTNDRRTRLYPGEKGLVGFLVIGSHEEAFVAHTWNWSEQQYNDHWKRALVRALDGKPAALVTDMRTPAQSSHLVWWPIWRVDGEVVFHNQLLFFAQYEIAGSHVDIERLYDRIGEHFTHNDEGVPVSQWHVPVCEIESFLREEWRPT
jgi:hypothetical protein